LERTLIWKRLIRVVHVDITNRYVSYNTILGKIIKKSSYLKQKLK